MLQAEKRATAAVERVLTQVGKLRPAPRRSSAALVLDVGGSRQLLELAWVGEGFPEDVHRALAATTREQDPEGLLLLVARRMSPGARRELEKLGISWVDETGAAWVRGPGLLVDRQPAPNTRERQQKTEAWSWSPAAAAIGEVVLTQSCGRGGAEEEITVGREATLAELAGVSVATASQTLRAWQREGWVENRGGERGPTAHRVLISPGGLLSSWAVWTAAQSPAEEDLHVLFKDATTWAMNELAGLMPANTAWCVGGLVASESYAPFVTAVPQVLCHVAAEDFDRAVAGLHAIPGVRPVERGARLTVRVAPGVTIRLASQAGQAPLASPPRIYADLLSEGVRGPEAAAHLREVVLGF